MFGPFMRWRSARGKRSVRSAGSKPSKTSRLSVEPVERRILLAAEISLFDGGVEIIDGNAVPIDFGTVAQGAVGVTRTFSIENDGDDTLRIDAISLPTGYSLIESTSSSIAVRGSDTFTVRLETATTGVKTGFITFSNNDEDESPFSFAITGEVEVGAAEITVLAGTTVLVDGSNVEVEFGSAILGQAGPVRTFTVRNDGTQSLTLGNIGLPSGFLLTDGLVAALPPGGFDSFSIQLSTAAATVRSGEVSFATNDANESPFNFRITGTVTPFELPDVAVLDGLTSISDGSTVAIDFGIGTIGQDPVSRTFTIRN